MIRCFLFIVSAVCAFGQNTSIPETTLPSSWTTTTGRPSLTEDEEAATVVSFTLLFLGFVVSSLALFKYRKGYYVEGRIPLLIWGMQLTQFTRVIVALLQIVFGSPCWIDRFSYFFVFPMFACLWARASRLIFQWEISQKLNEFHSLPSAERTTVELYNGRGGFFVRHRRWITPKYMYSAIFVYILIHLGLTLETCREDCPEIKVCHTVLCRMRDSRLMLIYIIEFFIFFIIASLRLRKRNDVLMVRRELITCFGLDFLTSLGAGVLFLSFNSSVVRYIFVSFGFTATACFVVWLPIFLDRRVQRKGVLPVTKLTVAAVLSDKHGGFKSMTSFLKSEFSAENAYFFQRIEDFRMSANKTDGSAEYIFDTFIASNSPYQVNLSAEIVAAIASALNRPNPPPKTLRAIFAKPVNLVIQGRQRSLSNEEMRGTGNAVSNFAVSEEEISSLFDAAQAEILHLLEKDSWVRYLQSAQFVKYSRKQMKNTNEYIDIVEEKMRTQSSTSRQPENPASITENSTGRKSTNEPHETPRRSTGIFLDTFAAVRKLTVRQHDNQNHTHSAVRLERSTISAETSSNNLPDGSVVLFPPDPRASDISLQTEIPTICLALQATPSDSGVSQPDTTGLLPPVEGQQATRSSDSSPAVNPIPLPGSSVHPAQTDANREYQRLE